jgi:hypothetical protein
MAVVPVIAVAVVTPAVTAPKPEGKPDREARAPVIRITVAIGITVVRITVVRITVVIGVRITAIGVRGIVIRITVVGVVCRWRGIWRRVDNCFRVGGCGVLRTRDRRRLRWFGDEGDL